MVWGLWYGLFLIIERTPIGGWLDHIWRPLRHAYVILVVMTGWVFFRAESMESALIFLKAMYGLGDIELFSLLEYIDSQLMLVLIAGIIGCAPVIHLFSRIMERGWFGTSRPVLYPFSYCYESLKICSIIFIFVLSTMSLFSENSPPFYIFQVLRYGEAYLCNCDNSTFL